MAEKKESVFRTNPFHPSLKTHKLSGKLAGLFSFSINQKYRIIFELNEDKREAYFHTAGDHDIYE